MQPGEAQLHLRFDRLDPGDLQVRRGDGRVVEQGRLADTRFTAQDQDTAQAVTGGGQDLIEAVALSVPAKQGHGRRRRFRCARRGYGLSDDISRQAKSDVGTDRYRGPEQRLVKPRFDRWRFTAITLTLGRRERCVHPGRSRRTTRFGGFDAARTLPR